MYGCVFFFQAEDGIRDVAVTGVQTCALPISRRDGGGATVQFRVRDTGIGISPEQLGTIFQEFTQADASMTRRYGGTGLGLAISRRFVALMGGELAVTSEGGHGSEFSFAPTFPPQAAQANAPAPRSPRPR